MNKSLREGWITVILLLAMGLVLAWTLDAARVAEGIQVLQFVVIAGTLAGILLGRTDIPDLLAHGASLILGAGVGVFAVSTLYSKEISWIDRWQSIEQRASDWLGQAVGGGESYDTLMFILFSALLFWLFSYVAGYAVFRLRVVWLAIVPNGVVIVMNSYYNPRLLPYFVSYLLLSLLLILRYSLFEREEDWQRDRVRYNPDIVFDFLRDGVLSAFVVIGLAWLFPVSTSEFRDWKVWDNFDEPWQEIQFHWNRVFASLNGYGPPQFSFFADTLELGGAVSLGEAPVMEVKASEPHYWRALTFDEYTGRGWNNTDPEEVDLEANAASPLAMPYKERKLVSQEVRLFRPGEKVIFAASQVASVNRATNTRLSYLPPIVSGSEEVTSTLEGPVAEISIMASALRFRRNETYIAQSWVSTAPPSLLRAAGTDYPQWVLDRYLQLPATLPQRVTDLAKDVTASEANPYDRASALERYLRGIQYNEAIPAPPTGVDVVDWFLFDSRQGYCDYYSTAMAVMLRAVGIPSRVARGYATGVPNEDGTAYTVRELDAHAWTEAYFPGYGWIEFEPTASEPELVRPAETAGTAETSDTPSSNNTGNNHPGYDEPTEDDLVPSNIPWAPATEPPWYEDTGWLVNLLPVLPVLLAGWLLWRIRQRRLRASTLVTAAFDNMIRYAARLGLKLRPHQTPNECASAVAHVLSEGTEDVWAITDLYVRQRYSGQQATVFDEMNAMDAWRRLRGTLRVYRILKLLPVKSETAERLRAAVRSGT